MAPRNWIVNFPLDDILAKGNWSILLGVEAWGKDVNFPAWFRFGTASSAYQIEGAWNVSDKGESIWDRLLHNHPEIDDGDVAANSYHFWQRDVEMLTEVGVDFYRFSISWPRLLPKGYSHHVSEDGARYYSDLIDGLLEKGIEPVVTIYHWDLPQVLQDKGGWTNPLIADWFADYARVVYSLYGDRVKTWITINEPIHVCELPYATDSWAPGIFDPGHSGYLCNKYVLLAHAKAWRIYDEEFKSQYGGKVSMGNFLLWVVPYTDSEEDKDLVNLTMEHVNGRYFHPIYSNEGGWPPAIEKLIEENSLKQGYPRSRLPPFTQEEIKLVQGTHDYQSVNYYTARLVRSSAPGELVSPIYYEGIEEFHLVLETSPEWEEQFADIIPLFPEGLRHGVAWLKEKYGDNEIFVSECGFSSVGDMDDGDRSRFIDLHLEQMLLSIYEDGVNLTGFTYWSLMDCHEWVSGFVPKFGLFHVDMTSPERTRTPRSSARHYSTIIRNRSLELLDPEAKKIIAVGNVLTIF